MTSEEMIRCAVEAGLKKLGFSDHTPYPFPKDHVSTFRMAMHHLADYVGTVEKVRKGFSGQLEIFLGVEAEYYPKYFEELLPILLDHGVEYMLLGQHFLYNETEGIGSIGPTADPARLRQYCNQTIDALYTGQFTYFAHPDLMHFIGDDAIYRREILRLCRTAKQCRIPLEINLLGFASGRHYPNRRFWELAAEEGCQVVLGCDAHRPEALLDEEQERKARALVADLGLELLEDIPLKRISR